MVFKIEQYVEKPVEKNTEKNEIEEEEEINEEVSEADSEKVNLAPKIMLFKCLGIGLSNIARNTN